MKGFSKQVEGPLGPWYQKVNAAIKCAEVASTSRQLLGILGEPDIIEQVSDEDRRRTEDGPIDDHLATEIWIYNDPYRPRIEYHFGISSGKIAHQARHMRSA